MRVTGSVIIALMLTILIAACSNQGNPSSPGIQENSTGLRQSESAPARIPWGLYDISIDTATGDVEIIPLRTAEFQANVVNFLQPPASPINLLKVSIEPGTNFPAGYVVCDVSIKHPFPGTKFCGFDVMGIVMGDWPGQTLNGDTDISVAMPPSTLLQNADGYTRWWNQVEFTSYGTLLGYVEGSMANPNFNSLHTLNGFKYFSDDLEAGDPFEPDLGNRGFFSSLDPGTNSRRYELQFYGFGGIKFNFKYAISASWIKPLEDTEPPYEPGDWHVDANMPEAFRIDVLDDGSTAYFENESTYGGDLNILIEIHDWQFDGNLSTVPSEISGIFIESPTLFPNSIEVDLLSASLVVGDPTAVEFFVSIEDVTPTSIENQLLVVTVNSANPFTYEPQIPGITGFDFPDGQLAAYNILEAPVGFIGPQNVSPVADASASNPLQGVAPLEVSLDPSLSYDPDGVLVLYEWDFEGDGTYDYSSPDPDPVNHVYDEGTHTAVLRVTDDDDATDTDEIEIESGCYSSPEWRTFRHDNRRTGRSSVHGPLTDNILYTWTEPEDKEIMSGITIDDQNRALFRSNSGRVFCVNPDGTTAWDYNVGGSWDYCTPSLGPDGSVYVGCTMGKLFNFDSEGNLNWEQDYPYGIIGGGIAVQEDYSVLFTTHGGYLVKTHPDGTVDWTFSTGDTMPDGPSVADDGTIYVANHGGRVYAVDQNGEQVWMSQVSAMEMSATPALGVYALYIGSWNGHVYGVDYDDGHVIWDTYLSSPSISSFAAVGCDGSIYIGSRDDNIYSLDQITGEINWTYTTCGDVGTMSPVLDGAGRLYCGSYCGHFYCLDAETGAEIWDKDLELSSTNSMYCKSPAITDDGAVIVGSNAGMLFAFKD